MGEGLQRLQVGDPWSTRSQWTRNVWGQIKGVILHRPRETPSSLLDWWWLGWRQWMHILSLSEAGLNLRQIVTDCSSKMLRREMGEKEELSAFFRALVHISFHLICTNLWGRGDCPFYRYGYMSYVICHMSSHPVRQNTQASISKSVVHSTMPELDKEISKMPFKFRNFWVLGPTQPNWVDSGRISRKFLVCQVQPVGI